MPHDKDRSHWHEPAGNKKAGFGKVEEQLAAEDQAAGAINGIDRYGVPRKFPLVSISIAALACQPGDYATAAEIATAAAGVKDHVKGTTGSNFIVVRGAGLHET